MLDCCKLETAVCKTVAVGVSDIVEEVVVLGVLFNAMFEVEVGVDSLESRPKFIVSL